MNKTLLALFCTLPLVATSALANTTWKHDLSVSAQGLTVGYDQDGGETTVGVGAISLTNSDTVDIGIAYNTSLLGGLSGSVSLDHQSDDDNVLGVDTSFSALGMTVAPSLDWNVTDSAFDGELALTYGIAGLDAGTTLYYDIDDTSYTGSDLSFGYNWTLSTNTTVTPNITVPFDTDWERGDATAGVSINLTF